MEALLVYTVGSGVQIRNAKSSLCRDEIIPNVTESGEYLDYTFRKARGSVIGRSWLRIR